MAGRQSAFITGANARIKIGGISIAYATDVNYSITIPTIPIETMGTYEVRDNVAVGYQVVGGFSVVKYTKNAANFDAPITITEDGQPPQTTSFGNVAIPFSSKKGNSPSAIPAGDAKFDEDGKLVSGSMNDQLNPKTLLQSATFDLFINEQLPIANGTGSVVSNVFRIQDCRIVKRDMQLDKRGVYMDRYTFVAILAGDNESNEFDADLSAFKDLE